MGGNLFAWLGMMLVVLGLALVLRKVYKKRERERELERTLCVEFERNSYYHNYLKHTQDRSRETTLNMEVTLAAMRSVALERALRSNVFSVRQSYQLKDPELLRRFSV